MIDMARFKIEGAPAEQCGAVHVPALYTHGAGQKAVTDGHAEDRPAGDWT